VWIESEEAWRVRKDMDEVTLMSIETVPWNVWESRYINVVGCD
jgi:hypothetical protein